MSSLDFGAICTALAGSLSVGAGPSGVTGLKGSDVYAPRTMRNLPRAVTRPPLDGTLERSIAMRRSSHRFEVTLYLPAGDSPEAGDTLVAKWLGWLLDAYLTHQQLGGLSYVMSVDPESYETGMVTFGEGATETAGYPAIVCIVNVECLNAVAVS
jgi:hypothetical protein